MKSKNLIGVLCVFALSGLSLPAGAQDDLSISYDNAGNIVERKLVSQQLRIRFDNPEKRDTILETLAKQIAVFPNPAQDALFVDGSLPDGFSETDLIIYDASGRVVLKSIYDGNTKAIEVGRFEPGIYMLDLVLDKKRKVTHKVIIAK